MSTEYDYGAAAPQAPTEQQSVPKKAVTFTGRMSKDVELRVTQNGNKVCNIDIAIDQLNGVTAWAEATFWGTDAQIAHDFLSKGDTLSGSGLMYTRTFQKKDGTMGSQLAFDNCSLLLSADKVQALILRIVDAKLAKLGQAPQATAPVQQAAPQPVAQPIQQAVVQAEPQAADLQINSDSLPF